MSLKHFWCYSNFYLSFIFIFFISVRAFFCLLGCWYDRTRGDIFSSVKLVWSWIFERYSLHDSLERAMVFHVRHFLDLARLSGIAAEYIGWYRDHQQIPVSQHTWIKCSPEIIRFHMTQTLKINAELCHYSRLFRYTWLHGIFIDLLLYIFYV